MTKRRTMEVLVALAVFVLLLAVILVKPTSRRTAQPPSIALFHRAPGAPPDFGNDSYQAIAALSPDSARALVLYPAEFEERADLYVIDRAKGDGYRLVLDDSLHAEDTPKAVGWLDSGHAWVIVGYTLGTVAPGGDLFEVDPVSGKARVLWASPEGGSVQAVGFTPPGTIRLKVFGENMLHERDSTVVLPAAALAAAQSPS
jgi:hypothetical protein